MMDLFLVLFQVVQRKSCSVYLVITSDMTFMVQNVPSHLQAPTLCSSCFCPLSRQPCPSLREGTDSGRLSRGCELTWIITLHFCGLEAQPRLPE